MFNKKFEIDENRILIYSIHDGYAKPTYSIEEGFLENGELKKTYILSQWDDYGLNGWIDNDEGVNKLSFKFDINHPLYVPLVHLLNYDDELLIDDDDTVEDNKKYLLVHKEEDKIYIDFIDNLENSFYNGERFHVFIKNILFDGRSKIDQNKKDTKIRLFDFFHEVHILLTTEYHQSSIEEYLLNNNTSYKYDQMKKVFKRNI